jgi:putative ABC transport system permease protein
LAESLSLCAIAGIIGLVLGFVIYQSAIFGASKLMKNMPFEWLVDPVALILSIVSIIVVGLLSGIFPALKAERLTVIEALRSE